MNCKHCGKPMTHKRDKNGPYLFCYYKTLPECKGKFREIFNQINPVCMVCYEPLKIFKSERGLFWGCKNSTPEDKHGTRSLTNEEFFQFAEDLKDVDIGF